MFTQIKDGIFRHSATNLVVHEARNVGDLIDANGVLVEWDEGVWIWKAGRDMHDLLAVKGCVSLSNVAQAMDEQEWYGGTWTFGSPDGMTSVTYPSLTSGTFIKSSDGYAGTVEKKTRTNARIFAVINNLAAGQGSSCNKNYVQYVGPTGDTWDNVAGSTRCYVNTVVFPNAGGSASDYEKHIRSNAVISAKNEMWTIAPDAHKLLGTAIIRVNLGKTWETLVNELIATLDHGDKAEVKAKCHEKMDPIVAKLKKVTPVPCIYVPVEIHNDGWYMVNPQCMNRAYVANLGQYCSGIKQFYSPMRGGIYMGNDGIYKTNKVWVLPNAERPNHAWSHGSVSEIAALGNGTDVVQVAAYPVKDIGVTKIASIDGVRMERILGGLAGINLSNTGEKDALTGTAFTSAQLTELWFDAIKFSETSSLLARGTMPNGVVEDNAQYGARLEGLNLDSEAALATRITQWDLHGFSAIHGIMSMLAALDGDKTNGKWLFTLWPGRLRVAPTYSCGQNGTYNAVAYITTPDADPLLPSIA